VISENQAIGTADAGRGRLRPDLVLKRKSDGKTFIVDVTIPFDNRLEAFRVAADLRRTRYANLAVELSGDQPAEVVPFVVGALGAWDPGNDEFLAKLCSRSYASKMRRLCVSEVISFSRDIYIEHLTGTRQRQL